jgi:6,7-dimethyl-8-ribityllumazine synthase
MSTADHNLSDYESDKVPSASDMRFGVVVSEWNPNVTEKLLEGVIETLKKQGASPDQIIIQSVPGSFELVYGASLLAQKANVDAVIALGSVVRGDTPHFDYVCQGVTQGIAYLNATQSVPVIFGLLTTDNMEQAVDRAGGIYGNKGDEAAVTAIKMVTLKRRF